MSGHRVRHDLDEDPTVHDSEWLDEPLVFEDGTATVEDEETARNLARRHTHLAYDGRVYEETDSDTDSWAEGEETVREAVSFDPDEHTVDEIRDLAEDVDNDDELAAIAELERDGQNRTTAVEAIEETRE